MKKRITILLFLTLSVVMILPGAALAWDKEDTLIANNDDFIFAGGCINNWTPSSLDESHYGADWFWGGDGFNLYQDIGSGNGQYATAGMSERLFAWTKLFAGDGGYYFALEASGWNIPPPPPVNSKPDWYPASWQFVIYANGVRYYNFVDKETKELPAIELSETIQWNGEAYKFSLFIPEGTLLTGENVLRIIIKDGKPAMVAFSGGEIAFSNPVTLE